MEPAREDGWKEASKQLPQGGDRIDESVDTDGG